MERLGRPVEQEHAAGHRPTPQDDYLWQESGAYGWYDPIARIGSWQHVSLLRPQSIADVNSYLSIHGEIVDRYQNLALPMPNNDFGDLTLGPVRIETLEPLKTHRMVITHDRVSCDVTMTTSVGPHWMNYEEAHGHWEGFGRMRGNVSVGEMKQAVSGFFFINRSWGRRDWSTILSYRLVTAIFGEDLIFRLFDATRQSGRGQHGYVLYNGKFLEVVKFDSEFAMDGDGVNIRGGKATVWTKDGIAFQLEGRCTDSDVMTQTHGFMNAQGNAIFTCGGRVGTGMLCAVELKAPTATMRRQLGLD